MQAFLNGCAGASAQGRFSLNGCRQCWLRWYLCGLPGAVRRAFAENIHTYLNDTVLGLRSLFGGDIRKRTKHIELGRCSRVTLTRFVAVTRGRNQPPESQTERKVNENGVLSTGARTSTSRVFTCRKVFCLLRKYLCTSNQPTR